MQVRAAVLEEFGQPLAVQDVELADPKAGEVLVRLEACGVCHTDLYTASGADPSGYAPCVLGHEGAGIVEAPRLLTHGLISRRALLPAAALTAVGLVGVMLASSWVMKYWVDLYARDYGGLGVVMAVFFWLGFSSVIIVWSAALAPALADRRELRRLPDSSA